MTSSGPCGISQGASKTFKRNTEIITSKGHCYIMHRWAHWAQHPGEPQRATGQKRLTPLRSGRSFIGYLTWVASHWIFIGYITQAAPLHNTAARHRVTRCITLAVSLRLLRLYLANLSFIFCLSCIPQICASYSVS